MRSCSFYKSLSQSYSIFTELELECELFCDFVSSLQDFGINRTLSDRLEGMSAELLSPAVRSTTKVPVQIIFKFFLLHVLNCHNRCMFHHTQHVSDVTIVFAGPDWWYSSSH